MTEKNKTPIIGIPDRTVTQPMPESTYGVGNPKDTFEYVLQKHEAKRAGLHFDLRLGDTSTGYGHSWAIRRFPDPGDKVLAVQQPTHTIKYFDFKGEIPTGYGAGKVSTEDRQQAEIIEASEGKVKFGLYRGSGPEEYNLIRTKENKWLLINSTPTRAKLPEIPDSKPRLSSLSQKKLILDDPTEVMQAKIDGAHSIYVIEPKKPIRTFSYRIGKKSPTGLIEHSQKLTELYNQKGPKDLKRTVLRGETWARNKSGPLSAPEVGGMLNATVWKSRELQKKQGKLIASPFDVVMYDGKNVEDAPYSERLKIVKDIVQRIRGMELPDMATTSGQKRELFEKVVAGKHPQTKEGVIMQDAQTSAPGKKVKLKEDVDVIIRKFFPGEGKYKNNAVGGFYYAYEDSPSKVAGKVGTGFSDALRKDMYKNPGSYLGKVVKVEGQEIYFKNGKRGAIQKPAFKEIHIDKNLT